MFLNKDHLEKIDTIFDCLSRIDQAYGSPPAAVRFQSDLTGMLYLPTEIGLQSQSFEDLNEAVHHLKEFMKAYT